MPVTAIAAVCMWLGGMNIFGNTLDSKLQGLNASITLPEYTGLPPILLASASGGQRKGGMIDIPEGSTINIDIPELSPLPTLEMGGKKTALATDNQGRLTASMLIAGGNTITLRQGWRQLASWRVRVLRDVAPRVAFISDPVNFDYTRTRLAYEASDDYGLKAIAVRIQPLAPMGGSLSLGAIITLNTPYARHVKEISTEDLTFLPWAGTPVEIKLEAKDSAGNTSWSDTRVITLPKREFSHPLAKALIEERAKLLRQPDEITRDEAANIMAGIARETRHYGNDPVVFLALRTGAVRLVLDRGEEVLSAVSRLIWQTAARIEDNMLQKAHNFLSQPQNEKG